MTRPVNAPDISTRILCGCSPDFKSSFRSCIFTRWKSTSSDSFTMNSNAFFFPHASFPHSYGSIHRIPSCGIGVRSSQRLHLNNATITFGKMVVIFQTKPSRVMIFPTCSCLISRMRIFSESGRLTSSTDSVLTSISGS